MTALRKGHEVYVDAPRPCNFCGDGTEAYADARIPRFGSWADVCKRHFDELGCATGVGRGQILLVRPRGGAA